MQHPYGPFGWIKLPGFYAIAIVVLEFVVVIVVTFSEGADRHEEAVTCGAFAGVGAAANPVAKGVDAKGRVMDQYNARRSSDEETTQSSNSTTADESDQCGYTKSHRNGNRHIIPVLPNGEFIFLQVSYPGERGIGLGAEKKPANMGIEKSLGDCIGIFFLIDVFVVAAVVCTPCKGGAFKCCSTKEKGEEPDWQAGLKREVRKEAMIAQRDAQAGRDKKEKEEAELKKAESKCPDVPWHRKQCRKQRAGEK